MSYMAKALNVMIASPSDVPQERNLVREVISEWNAVNASDRKTVLMPIGWETHSVPDTGQRPQSIINGQLLKTADLLVAVFWTRLGSPTGVAPSGTVEEIEEHMKAGKPAMIYFSTAPVVPDSINAAQYEALMGFKESLGLRGLYHKYESLSEFRITFARHLAKRIIDFQDESPTAPDPPNPVVLVTPAVPQLSDRARELLLEAANAHDGSILSLQAMAGRIIQANGKQFGRNRDARSQAEWKSALDELEGQQLVEARGSKREIFSLTTAGYAVVDRLRLL